MLWRRTPDGVVLLPSEVVEPVLLGGAGADIWELLAEPRSEGQLTTGLAEMYPDTDPGTIRSSVTDTLRHLENLGAISAA